MLFNHIWVAIYSYALLIAEFTSFIRIYYKVYRLDASSWIELFMHFLVKIKLSKVHKSNNWTDAQARIKPHMMVNNLM